MPTAIEYFAHAQPRKLSAWWKHTSGESLTSWVSDGLGNVTYRDPLTGEASSAECFRIDPDTGWLIVTGFGPPYCTEPTISGDMVKAQLIDLDSGYIVEMPPRKGIIHYYAPPLVPATPWGVRHWFKIDGTIPAYYEAHFRYGGSAKNTIFYDEAQRTQRDVIHQREIWGNYNDRGEWVWTRGSGTVPYDAHGDPVIPSVRLEFGVTLARNMGVWTGQSDTIDFKFGCYSIWSY